MGHGIGVQDGIRANVAIGGELLRNGSTTYGAETLAADIKIPIGKNFTIDPQINGKLGEDIKGIGFQLGTTTQINPKLGINAGFGVRQTSFGGTITNEESIYSDGKLTGMEGEEDLIQKGDFFEQTNIFTKTDTKRTNTEGYIFAGAKYNVTSRLAISAGGEVGYKHGKFGKVEEYKNIEGERCIQGAELKYEELADGFWTYVWSGKPVIEKYSGQTYNKTEITRNSIVGGITGGAEYEVKKNLTVGVDGKVGFGNNADSRVGLNLKVKF